MGVSGGAWSDNWQITRSTKCVHLLKRLYEVGAASMQVETAPPPALVVHEDAAAAAAASGTSSAHHTPAMPSHQVNLWIEDACLLSHFVSLFLLLQGIRLTWSYIGQNLLIFENCKYCRT